MDLVLKICVEGTKSYPGGQNQQRTTYYKATQHLHRLND